MNREAVVVRTSTSALARWPEPPRPPVPDAVLAVVRAIHERYGEGITAAQLAAEVYVSQFHFSRVFTMAVGVSPGRFIRAVRLVAAKRLLLSSTLSIADIVCEVGYSSVGSFTSRFTATVGMTPTSYRALDVADRLVAIAPGFCRIPDGVGVLPPAAEDLGRLTLRAGFPGAGEADVFVGLFDEPVPHGQAIASAVVRGARSGDPVSLQVPAGSWWVTVAARARGGFLAARSTVEVRSDAHSFLTLLLREPEVTDVPFAATVRTRPASVVSLRKTA
jgi:AraC family transcriptional regulator